MATSKKFVDYILDQLNDTNVRARAMFGEYALYYDNKVVALICDDTVYLKITPGTQQLLGKSPTGKAYPGSKDFYILDEAVIEKPATFAQLVKICAHDIPAKK